MSVTNVIRTFTNESRLTEWLEDRRDDLGNHGAFIEWLSLYYLEGNKIEASGKSYGYAECMELI